MLAFFSSKLTDNEKVPMPRSYRCKTCGSDQVYHHCVAPRINLATIQKVRKAAVVMAKPVQPVVVPPPQSVQPMKEVNVLTTCQLDGCNNEAKAAISGVKWINGKVMRIQGDRLCAPCYDRLYETVAAYYPRPGYSKPKGQLVARYRDMKTLEKEAAITLACCFGHLERASSLMDSPSTRVPVASI